MKLQWLVEHVPDRPRSTRAYKAGARGAGVFARVIQIAEVFQKIEQQRSVFFRELMVQGVGAQSPSDGMKMSPGMKM